ncbi:MAG: acyl carrier protein [Sandaracinaceae bacterium]|nr:acyl carrier protein [Sandaracinaceae bacterium]
MTHEEIRAVVVSALSDVAPESDPGAIDPSADLREELDIDSMDFLAFVTALHDRLGVSVPERDYPAVGTIDGAVRYLASRVGA